MSTSIQNELLDQNIWNSLETRDHLQATWKLERTNEMSAFQKLLPNFGEHPNYMHFYLDHGEIQGHEMILNFIFRVEYGSVSRCKLFKGGSIFERSKNLSDPLARKLWNDFSQICNRSLIEVPLWSSFKLVIFSKWIKVISKYMIIYIL